MFKYSSVFLKYASSSFVADHVRKIKNFSINN